MLFRGHAGCARYPNDQGVAAVFTNDVRQARQQVHVTEPTTRFRAVARLAALPLVIVIAVVVAWKLGYFDLDRRQRLFDTVQELRLAPWIEGWFIAAFALVLALCLPANLATMLAGAVFGTWTGAVVSWVGSMVATMLAYVLARSIAQRPIKRLFGEHKLLRQLRDHDDVASLFRMRVVPVAPFAVLPYVAGIAGVSLRRLVIASAIGGIPGSVAYAYVGSKLLAGIVSGTDARRPLVIAAGVTVVMLVVSVLPALVRKMRD
jgi:uncharacterized membrane protein YdjX (TVP38/TMEM64 family)